MAYKILYSPEDARKYPISRVEGKGKWLRCTLVCIALCSLLSVPKVRIALEKWLIPGDVDGTKTALSTMLEQIRTGEPIEEAVSAFCREIIYNENQGKRLDA